MSRNRSRRDVEPDVAVDSLVRSRRPSRSDESSAPIGRRRFMAMGAGSGLSSLALAACVRKPKEKILPFAQRPEDRIPGKPRHFATSAYVAGSVLGLVVESQDGRPTKIEGNPKHPGSFRGTSAWAQAEVLNLYDPDRARTPSRRGKTATWEQAFEAIDEALESAGEGGSRLAILTEAVPSPTFERLVGELREKYPKALVVEHDLAVDDAELAGRSLLGVPGVRAIRHYHLADRVLSLDADLFGSEPDCVRSARLWADRRRTVTGSEDVGRLYVVEPCFTVTGACADNRLPVPASRVAAFASGLLAELLDAGLTLPAAASRLAAKVAGVNRESFGRWVPALAKDLVASRGSSIVVAGRRQPPVVHAMADLLNEALDNTGRTVTFVRQPAVADAASLPQLSERLENGSVGALIVIGGNPVYDAPRDLRLAERFGKAGSSVHLSTHRNETSEACGLHVPRSHFLESWCDLRASDGTPSVQQPLIAPLHDTVSELELLARLIGRPRPRGYELVKETWRTRASSLSADAFERRWRRWLQDGLVSEKPVTDVPEPRWSRLAEAWARQEEAEAEPPAIEIDFALDASTFDGRYANNAWMQELPDPTTKLSWEHAAYASEATARSLGADTGDVLRVEAAGAVAEVPLFVIPGTADGVLVVPLGYGRRVGGQVAEGVGADTFALREQGAAWIATATSVTRSGRTRQLCTTQEHGRSEGRGVLRETTLEAHRANPEEVGKVHGPPLKSLWQEPHPREGQQWGMSIDLSACTGCNACVLACQAENNIPVVGRERVLDGREMHWIRVDRYFEGSGEATVMQSQPMACTHCENAPCESVCPVAATTHSPEGLNDMAYNRCIGTRYCSNNCPLKVRRFNFFNYNDDIEPLESLQKNPDVTIRFRGVMEKCTYCVQRINQAKIVAKRDGNGVVPDGAIVTACEQACPTAAIVFGDVADSTSRVSKAKAQARDYAVLAELNIKPRTTYLARIRNPNPELE